MSLDQFNDSSPFIDGMYADPPVVKRVPIVARETAVERGQDNAEHIEGQIIEAMRAMQCRGTSFKEHYNASSISVEYGWETNPDRYIPQSCSMYVQLCNTDLAGSSVDAVDVVDCLIMEAVRLKDDLVWLRGEIRAKIAG